MTRITSKNEVRIYEIDHKESEQVFIVESDGIFGDRVILVIGGHHYQVVAKDLRLAIDNATHVD
jgi:hypothetical protein